LALFPEQVARRYVGDAGRSMKTPSRYIVRRTKDDRRYSVWDNDNHKVAVCEFRECGDLSFEDAFKMVDRLNAEEAEGN
jgi:hypothetical protein